MSEKYLKIEEKYKKEAISALQKKFGIKNKMAAPKIIKVVVNSGLGRRILAIDPGKPRAEFLGKLKDDFKLITGQASVETKARKSIASFKSRAGMIIGLKATLRGGRMYDFLDRVIGYVLPRTRDFRGLLAKNIDKSGNFNIGIKETAVFPEVPPSTSRNNFGFQITIVTSAKNRQQAIELYRLLGFPFKKGEI